jgi:hypothetical protein
MSSLRLKAKQLNLCCTANADFYRENPSHTGNTYGIIDKLFEHPEGLGSRGCRVLFFCAVKSREFVSVFLHSWTYVPRFPNQINTTPSAMPLARALKQE